jgi:hypothetical protein
MAIKRSGPPTTHDRVTWRVPLDGPPSIAWQAAFKAAEETTAVANPTGVRFEAVALSFRSADEHVPTWVEYIDKWIARANQAQTELNDQRRDEASRAQQERASQRQKITDANERFKDL